MSITFLLFLDHYFLKDEKKYAWVVRKWSQSVSGAPTVFSKSQNTIKTWNENQSKLFLNKIFSDAVLIWFAPATVQILGHHTLFSLFPLIFKLHHQNYCKKLLWDRNSLFWLTHFPNLLYQLKWHSYFPRLYRLPEVVLHKKNAFFLPRHTHFHYSHSQENGILKDITF